MSGGPMNAERLLEVYEQISEAPDAIARLRRFVLDLAVRGKLVEQDAADEPVSLEPEKLLVSPAKALPLGWAASTVGQILDFQYGKGKKKSERLDYGPVPVFGSNGIVGYSDEHLTQKDAIIIGRKGSAGALNLCIGPSWTTDVAYYLEPTSEFQIHYLLLTLTSMNLHTLGKGVKPGLSRSDAYPLEIHIPPLAEQHRIVAKVDELMALCDRLEEARKTREEVRDKLTASSLARLTAPDASAEDFPTHAAFALEALPALTTRPDQIKTLRQTILNLAVRGKLVEQDAADEPASALLNKIETERQLKVKAKEIRVSKPLAAIRKDELPFDLPSGWAWVRLGNIIKLISGQHLQPSEYSESFDGGLPYITGPSDFSANGAIARRAALVRKAVATKGQLLITVKGSGVGKAMICDLNEVAISRQLMAMEPLGWKINFLELITDRLAVKLQEEARSLIPGISRQDINEFVVALPPLAEQHRIVAKVDALMALCDRLEAALTTADTTRTRLLEALLHEALEPTTDTKEAAE